jgi:hypothetical protein
MERVGNLASRFALLAQKYSREILRVSENMGEGPALPEHAILLIISIV